MGSSVSKAAQNGARKFPTRAPGTATPVTATRPEMHRSPNPTSASFSKEEARRADAHTIDFPPLPQGAMAPDASFSSRLKQMGVAQPNPTFSPSSTANPTPTTQHMLPNRPVRQQQQNETLKVLEMRRRIQEQAAAELEDESVRGDKVARAFLDVGTIREALVMRQRGVSVGEIERTLRLRKGVVKSLAEGGVVRALPRA